MIKVEIRPLHFEDSAISYLWRNDSDVWKYTGKRPNTIITQEIEEKWIIQVLSENDSKRFAILADGRYIGNIQLTNLVCNQDAEYHIFIGDKNYWNKGIGQKATYLLLNIAFNELNLKEVFLYVNPLNLSAFRMYEKLGFEKIDDQIKMRIQYNEFIKPKVSVFMLTYNHEKYIKRAIESILSQQCYFNFDVVIGDDSSSDKTREIIQEYANKFKDKFKLVFHAKNIGAKNNHIQTQKQCLGKYIAICEGDDYWTDPYKIQKQVDFLETNESYSHCWTRFIKLDESTQTFSPDLNERYFQSSSNGIDFNYEIFCKGWEIGMQTLVFRNGLFDIELAKHYKYFKDTHLITHLLNAGKGYCINSCAAVYRLHKNGVNTSLSEFHLARIGYLTYLELFRKHKSNNFLRLKYEWFSMHYVTILLKNRYRLNSVKIIIQNFIILRNISLIRDMIYLLRKSF